MSRKKLEKILINDRHAFLEEIGLDDSIIGKFGLSESLISVEVMRNSYKFFSDLGADIQRVYKKYPRLLAHHKDTNLGPKLQFLVDEIGISRRTVARLPELFTYSLDSMRNNYQHYTKEFGENKQQAKALLRDATTIFGNDTTLIDNKMREYKKAGIDFHRNYTLLEINPKKAIDTRDYLTELEIQEPKTEKWYHMLLTVSRKTLEPKVEYYNREKIDWKIKPKVLLLGLGTDEKPGALVRRVNMIKNAFQNKPIPFKLDYKINPAILDSRDSELKNRIKKYK